MEFVPFGRVLNACGEKIKKEFHAIICQCVRRQLSSN